MKRMKNNIKNEIISTSKINQKLYRKDKQGIKTS